MQALEDAVARLQKQHKVALEGGGADVVDYTTKEAIQHKRIFGEKEGKDALETRSAMRRSNCAVQER